MSKNIIVILKMVVMSYIIYGHHIITYTSNPFSWPVHLYSQIKQIKEIFNGRFFITRSFKFLNKLNTIRGWQTKIVFVADNILL